MKKEEEEKQVPPLPPHAALRKKGGGNGTARHRDVFLYRRRELGIYDSLRSTVLVRHAKCGRKKSPAPVGHVVSALQRVLAVREGAPYRQSYVREGLTIRQSICG